MKAEVITFLGTTKLSCNKQWAISLFLFILLCLSMFVLELRIREIKRLRLSLKNVNEHL